MSDNLKKGRWHPSRVMTAIGRIGYSPASAILDIVDNSVSAGATKVNIHIEVEKEQREGRGRRRSLVSGIRISDNGSGMDDERLDEAIALGSSAASYEADTLSRFGMGLKSASASLGNQLTIVTRDSAMRARTLVQDQDVIAEVGDYVYSLGDASNEELALVESASPGGSGTVVMISKIHHNNMTSPGEIIEELQRRAGAVYFFALQEKGLELFIIGEPIAPFDPLFESDITGDLDERTWDGLEPKYIHRSQVIQLTPDGSVTARVTMTQLPHPPSMQKNGVMSRAHARDKYNIGAGNYGFYIYRNGRMIEWAASLDMVPLDQDLYSFRGRLEIASDADDVLNIDVTKSRILLSDTARIQLTPLLSEGVKMSRAAWQNAWRSVETLVKASAHEDINEHLDRISEIEDENDRLDEEASPEPERAKLKQRRQEATEEKTARPDEQEAVREQNQRVQYVPMLENNMLWERAHDPSQGIIVRVNMAHRLYRDVIQPLQENAPVIKVLDTFFFSLARAEYDLVYKTELLDTKDAVSVMDEFRERAGAAFSEVIRIAGAENLTSG